MLSLFHVIVVESIQLINNGLSNKLEGLNAWWCSELILLTSLCVLNLFISSQVDMVGCM